MNFSDSGALYSGLLIGLLGLGLFIYGRKAGQLKCVLVGIVLGALPLVVTSAALLWGIAGLSLVGLRLSSRLAR